MTDADTTEQKFPTHTALKQWASGVYCSRSKWSNENAGASCMLRLEMVTWPIDELAMHTASRHLCVRA